MLVTSRYQIRRIEMAVVKSMAKAIQIRSALWLSEDINMDAMLERRVCGS